jgi:nucleoside phosphorylase
MTGETQATISPKAAVVLTAIQVETEAVLRHLADRGQERVLDTWFHTGKFDGYTIAIAEVGPGNARAATIAIRALTRFRPEIAAFVGVAGGLKDVLLGDVVVATKVYNYESGKELPSGFQVRPDLQTSHHELEQRARVIRISTNWHDRLDSSLWSDRKPTVHVGPIAAGEAVVASTKGRIAAHLKQHYGDALAVEMEGHGFLEAAHIDSGCRAVVVRGISDNLIGKIAADKLGWQRSAADAAAAFFFEMLAFGTDAPLTQTPLGPITSAVDDNRGGLESVHDGGKNITYNITININENREKLLEQILREIMK